MVPVVEPNRLSAVGRDHRRGSATELHHLDLVIETDLSDQCPAGVVWCDYSTSALVLGSRQSPDLANRQLLTDAGIELVGRRSGGGAVLMVPGDLVWIDVVARVGMLSDDVRVSMVEVGAAWAEALDSLGLIGSASEVTVYDGPMRLDDWGELVCFGGLGPGELVLDGRKLVGLSQRRTRAGVRISGAIHHRSLVAETASLLVGALPRSVPPDAATIGGFDPLDLVEALAGSIAALTERRSPDRG